MLLLPLTALAATPSEAVERSLVDLQARACALGPNRAPVSDAAHALNRPFELADPAGFYARVFESSDVGGLVAAYEGPGRSLQGMLRWSCGQAPEVQVLTRDMPAHQRSVEDGLVLSAMKEPLPLFVVRWRSEPGGGAVVTRYLAYDGGQLKYLGTLDLLRSAKPQSL